MKFILFLLLGAYSSLRAHPHHHSLAIFDYNDNTQQFEVSLKVLTEDYKKITQKQSLQEYVNQHLKVSIVTKNYPSQYLGMESNPENTWLYLTIDVPCDDLTLAKTLTITNTILVAENNNQFNTVKINNAKQQEIHNFPVNKKEHGFNLEKCHFSCKKT